jgi:multiple sugar transport system substrate-binding protein
MMSHPRLPRPSALRQTGAIHLVAVLCLAILGACSQSLENIDPADQEITYWCSHSGQLAEDLQKMAAEFNAANPHGITVETDCFGSYAEVYDRTRVAIQTGKLPALISAYGNQAIDYHRSNSVVDLAPYMASPRWGLTESERQDYIDELLNKDNADGVQVALRPNFSVELLYYNADWLYEMGYDAPPTTWARFARMCREATLAPFSGQRGSARPVGYVVEEDASRLASMVFSRGGDLMNIWQQAYTFDTEPMRLSLGMLRELNDYGAVAQVIGHEEAVAHFATGQALFFTGTSSQLGTIGERVQQFAWDVMTLPRELKGRHNVYGGSLAVCRTTPEAQLAAWLFIRWFTQPEQQSRWVQETCYFPVRRSAAPEQATYYRMAFDLLSASRSEPTVIRYQHVRTLLAQAVRRALNGEDLDRMLPALEIEANATLIP